MSILVRRALEVHQREGLRPLVRKVARYLLAYENFQGLVYENTLVRRNEAAYRPRIENTSVKIITTEDQLDDLSKSGFDLSSDPDNLETRHRIKKGAVAFFVFVGSEIASKEWAAMNPEAKATFNNYPYRVDFAAREACAGGAWTRPKYRAVGINTYLCYKMYEYLRENEIAKVWSLVEINNIAAQQVRKKFAPQVKIRKKARYVRLLGFQFWKETPIGEQTKVT
jgi:hypothetical protein